jgi:hypothetical protein
MGIFGRSSEPLPDWAIRSSVFMTLAQALSIGRQTPASGSIPEYSKLFSAVVAQALYNGLISDEVFQAIQYSPYQIMISKDDANEYRVNESNSFLYLQQGMELNKALNSWKNSKSITNDDQMNIFSALAMACNRLGMDEDDQEMLGLLLIVSVFYTTALKDSQADKVNFENWRSIATFFATELPNRWLLERSK